MSAEPLDPRTFRNVLGQFCTGITIITTVHDDVPIGFACQSFAALSLDPPLVLFCPTKVSRSWAAIKDTGRFCVNVLHEKQKDVSARFGSKEPDKFQGLSWRPANNGMPWLQADTVAHAECTTEQEIAPRHEVANQRSAPRRSPEAFTQIRIDDA